MREIKTCKFCGNPVSIQKFTGDEDREYDCGKCSQYCMQKCKEALKTTTSWHKEPCVSCKHNPYSINYRWDGEKWVKKDT